jgi:hypothetical protein
MTLRDWLENNLLCLTTVIVKEGDDLYRTLLMKYGYERLDRCEVDPDDMIVAVKDHYPIDLMQDLTEIVNKDNLRCCLVVSKKRTEDRYGEKGVELIDYFDDKYQ